MIKKLLHLKVIVLFSFFLFSVTIKAENQGSDKYPLVISPSKLSIKPGKSIDFKVKCTTEKNVRVEEKCAWNIIPDSLGLFDGSKFTATNLGKGIIVASCKEYIDTINVKVLADSDSGNSKNDNKNGQYPAITFKNGNGLKSIVGESEAIKPVYHISNDYTSEIVLRKNYLFQSKVNPLIALPRGEIINRPNPFIESTSFEFELSAKTAIKLVIFDLYGKVIKMFSQRILSEGRHMIQWDGTDDDEVPAQPGLYLEYFLKTESVLRLVR